MDNYIEKNYLKRSDVMNLIDIDKIKLKTMSISDIEKMLENLESELSKHEFEMDKNYIMNSRRKFLKSEIDKLLSNSSEDKNEIISKSLWHFWEFIIDDYPGGAGSIMADCRELGISIQEFDAMDITYRKKGIICFQEKEVILNIIDLIKNYIKD